MGSTHVHFLCAAWWRGHQPLVRAAPWGPRGPGRSRTDPATPGMHMSIPLGGFYPLMPRN
ncbi:hypothetical protein SLNWT_2260 [Streptomyces albus]|uniref:Uncharacterized protein n=1 Tax=Streptomyces albus (strain ATCC 21838 / DSM 41398 / FERM P-419 / JCM 4703 / NBRC 107858) TaxID=1081613 RepID=A0A0B5EVB8_STRA4|nr:hypothetical protein SLNWT_2260 [Streptomyces albus]AOU76949.1 hypothetical protein SLNHY_2258 [Streptomyces albus]AYN32727.1 hypothetical protein DUI70_2224 [Streptomyces albus]